jgi:hypothetical protein
MEKAGLTWTDHYCSRSIAAWWFLSELRIAVMALRRHWMRTLAVLTGHLLLADVPSRIRMPPGFIAQSIVARDEVSLIADRIVVRRSVRIDRNARPVRRGAIASHDGLRAGWRPSSTLTGAAMVRRRARKAHQPSSFPPRLRQSGTTTMLADESTTSNKQVTARVH